MLKIAHHTRQEIANILHEKDHRLVVIVGPCSIHHTQSAMQYAKNLQKQIEKHRATLCIVMRTYVEKARSNSGWKGFVSDPDLNNTGDIQKGLSQAKALLQAIHALGVPCAMEIVNPFTAHYFAPYLSWAAIGARTVESQIHREIASILPLPIGFKNTTGGDIQAAIDGAQTAAQPHHFLGVNATNNLVVQHSMGNPNTHIVLRGSKQASNYDINTVQSLQTRVMIDCSHGNSQKDHVQQLGVAKTLASRIAQGETRIFGVMLESHLMAGKQAWSPNKAPHPNQSITDACIGWEETEKILGQLANAVLIRDKCMVS